MLKSKSHTKCRVCGNENLKPYLDLGLMPLSNNLSENFYDSIMVDREKLEVALCEHCGLSQLTKVVDRDMLFGHYVYRSGIAKSYVDHCAQMSNQFNLTSESFHIDIAGNDGTLLHEFKKKFNHKTLNVDPAINLEKSNRDKDIRMFSRFWGYESAKHLTDTGWPKANLITATNVFAHVDNVQEFLGACKNILADGGSILLEFPYIIDFISNVEFDTVYFEHLSYFSIRPIYLLCDQIGLKIVSVSHQTIHGGSLRVILTHRDKITNTMDDLFFMEMDMGFNDVKTYEHFAVLVKDCARSFRDKILKLSDSGFNISAFAASAKGNVLLNYAGINQDTIDCIYDQTPEKIGKFSPGTGIPIVAMDFSEDQPDYIVILSWNFADEIIYKCRDAGYKNKFILPLNFEII